MRLSLVFQLLGIVLSATAPLLFAATRLPYIKKYTRPSAFEKGWYFLNLQRNLNYRDDGFEDVLLFIIGHQTQNGNFVDRVADDSDINPSDVVPETGVPAVEELRILTRPTDFSEQILLCYNENTEGPSGEPDETERLGLELFNTDEYSDEWRWFGPLTGTGQNALRHVNEETQKWTTYGTVVLSVGVVCQILAVAL